MVPVIDLSDVLGIPGWAARFPFPPTDWVTVARMVSMAPDPTESREAYPMKPFHLRLDLTAALFDYWLRKVTVEASRSRR